MAWRRYLAFDLDGTLIDSAPDIADAVNALLGELGAAPVAEKAIRAMIGDGAPVLLARALRTAGMDQDATLLMPRFRIHYEAAATSRTTLYPGVREGLHALAAEGRALVLCTNKPLRATEVVLDHFDLRGLFRTVIGGDSLPQRKPEKEPLLAAIAGAGGDPARAAEEAVMVGDSHTDLATAKAAGIPAVIIPSGYGRKADRDEQGDYDEVSDFSGLAAAIRALDQN
jgi:phosphoglycolate phosphatase